MPDIPEKVDKAALLHVRQQLHQAMQIPAAVARSFLPKQEDDRFASLEWIDKYGALCSQWFGQAGRFRIGLQVAEFTLVFLDGNAQRMGVFPLNHRTQQEAIAWTKYMLKSIGMPESEFHLLLPYEIPVYPTSNNQPFSYEPVNAFACFAQYFSVTDAILQLQRKREQKASHLRCWPHHFDMSLLITLEKNKAGEATKTVSAGFSPGDNYYNEPYFFVNPWPYPDMKITNFPTVKGDNFWHQQDWTGLILLTSTMSDSGRAAIENTIADFFTEGIALVKSLIQQSNTETQ